MFFLVMALIVLDGPAPGEDHDGDPPIMVVVICNNAGGDGEDHKADAHENGADHEDDNYVDGDCDDGGGDDYFCMCKDVDGCCKYARNRIILWPRAM